jgi:hypothetical protein
VCVCVCPSHCEHTLFTCPVISRATSTVQDITLIAREAAARASSDLGCEFPRLVHIGVAVRLPPRHVVPRKCVPRTRALGPHTLLVGRVERKGTAATACWVWAEPVDAFEHADHAVVVHPVGAGGSTRTERERRRALDGASWREGDVKVYASDVIRCDVM